MSLLRDSTYQWWNTLVSIVPRERIMWEFLQEEFRKKYISQRFIDQKRKEFLELKQGQMSVAEYEQLPEFVALVERACKAEELIKERRKTTFESRDLRKRNMGKSHQPSSKRLREFTTQSNASVGYSNRYKNRQNTTSKAPTTSVASVGSTWPNRPDCSQCGRHHFGDCRGNAMGCFKSIE
ncbi:uncharacterized protein [Gossypium hirsutum]|uniref:Retrotransposon gag domain-containing protein n=1 Tax=Gossypium hirsutum TaxID=3635 RepID=A0ABM2ZDK3_GOSHI|nr:uncharacterized protein LOC121212270 [Gossypium hirsutum]